DGDQNACCPALEFHVPTTTVAKRTRPAVGPTTARKHCHGRRAPRLRQATCPPIALPSKPVATISWTVAPAHHLYAELSKWPSRPGRHHRASPDSLFPAAEAESFPRLRRVLPGPPKLQTHRGAVGSAPFALPAPSRPQRARAATRCAEWGLVRRR